MSFDLYTHLTSWLAFAANGLTAAVLFRPPRLDARRLALAAGLVAALSMVGSLIYSNVYDLEPCRMCWYQRIAMYPLVVIFAIAAWKSELVKRYALPFAVGGLGVAGWHYLMHHFPSLESACSAFLPCSAPYVWRYGFVSIPYMALSAFALITLLLVRTKVEA
jgi:disulfide bond formation protein DsbB